MRLDPLRRNGIRAYARRSPDAVPITVYRHAVAIQVQVHLQDVLYGTHETGVDRSGSPAFGGHRTRRLDDEAEADEVALTMAQRGAQSQRSAL